MPTPALNRQLHKLTLDAENVAAGKAASHEVRQNIADVLKRAADLQMFAASKNELFYGSQDAEDAEVAAQEALSIVQIMLQDLDVV